MLSQESISNLTVNIMSYGYGHLAAQAIESVLNQSKLPGVIRFFDDGAGDCKHLPKIYPEIEYVLRDDNWGIVPNFNDALRLTTTEKVMFLGADNWLVCKALEKMQHKADIVSCDAWIIHPGSNEYWSLPYQPHGSAIYNVAKAKSVGGYAPSGNENSEEDSVLFKEMRDAGATFHYVGEPLLIYRRHRANFIHH